MKQLLVVKSTTPYSGDPGSSTPGYYNGGIEDGQIAFFNLEDNSLIGYVDITSPDPTPSPILGNFGIALGRPNNQMPLTMPEVDINTLTIARSLPTAGSTFELQFMLPVDGGGDVEEGEEYTLVLVKNGTVPHERNTWTYTHMATSSDVQAETAAFVRELNNKFNAMSSPFTAETYGSGDLVIRVVCKNAGEAWTPRFADRMSTTQVTTYTASTWADQPGPTTNNATCLLGYPALCDNAYVKNLASQCAAGKGFTETYANGPSTIPGYPEEVPGNWYTIYTFRFQVGRDSAKTRDEKVWQLVHVAVPVSSGDVIDGQELPILRGASTESNGLIAMMEYVFSSYIIGNDKTSGGDRKEYDIIGQTKGKTVVKEVEGD